MFSSHTNIHLLVYSFIHLVSQSVSQLICLTVSQSHAIGMGVFCMTDWRNSQLANFQCILLGTEQWKHIPQRTIQWLMYLTPSTLFKFCDSRGGYTHYWLGARWLSGRVSDSKARVGNSKPTSVMLCHWARHFTLRKYWQYPGSSGFIPTWLNSWWRGR